VAVHKKGSKDMCCNYRPISCLNVGAKVLETVSKIQITKYFEDNKLFSSSQHGFRAKRSTNSALIDAHTKWTNAMDEGKIAGVLSFDLSSAFDCVSADLLCNKLKIYGFDNISIGWVRSYLSDRSQFVCIGNDISEVLIIKVGSPQGSVISPVLFIILLSDIDLWSEHSTISGFADDNSATVIEDTFKNMISKLESDACHILSFMASNSLVANEGKTTFMVFSNKRRENPDTPLSLKVGNSNIIEVREQKLLGIIFSSDLKWNRHISSLIEKVHHRLHILKNLSHLLPRAVLTIVAECLIMSNIRYCLPLFGRSRQNDLEPIPSEQSKLQVIQNHMLRTIYALKIKDKTNMTKLRTQKDVMSINQITCQAIIMEFRKALQFDTLPHTMEMINVERRSNINTRSSSQGQIRPLKCRLSTTSNSFPAIAVRLWNKLPEDLRKSPTSDAIFKRSLAKWIKNSDIP